MSAIANQYVRHIVQQVLLPVNIHFPTKFSETDDPIFTKLHRKVEPHLKRCILVLEFSKWPPIQKLKKWLKIQK
jgi:hypothetical protein